MKVLACLPATWLAPLLSSETRVEKKVATGVAKVSEKLLPLHPASEEGAFHELKPKNFFRSDSWKKAGKVATFAPRFRTRNGRYEVKTKKIAKTFFFPLLGKSNKLFTFAPCFHRKLAD
ncbi:hypothetical protein [Hymenobacter perfusus]|uniref:Uncharacterized protein n=1 Tax=Hymenobacter perfusus TaxID=1236770 RepID=A0A3R9MPW4_9BACT|nr:hypothetical protein [Hymenobacter perfusus]RSK45596.1 hypothetical protein EI293_00005 [Hymenobacter perfusus]